MSYFHTGMYMLLISMYTFFDESYHLDFLAPGSNHEWTPIDWSVYFSVLLTRYAGSKRQMVGFQAFLCERWDNFFVGKPETSPLAVKMPKFPETVNQSKFSQPLTRKTEVWKGNKTAQVFFSGTWDPVNLYW